MTRFSFRVGIQHPARLRTVWHKPVENERTQLLRLEFEIFQRMQADRLKSTGMIACRDIVIGNSSAVTADPGVQRYAQALGIRRPDLPSNWLDLAGRQRWVLIEFARPNAKDIRNPFRQILPFIPPQSPIDEYPYDLSLDWVTPAQAARQLRKSPRTIHRLVDKFEAFHGGELVWRTKGGHRRINMKLLQNLVPAPSKSVRQA